MKYDFRKIEPKWQKKWEKDKIYEAKDPSARSGQAKKKWYSLIEFPYPSGAGLHTGHIRSNTAMDIISRKRRMEGFNVLYPIGWDAFGLPTENYAIKTGIAPQVVVKHNTDTFRRQLKSLGFSFDWSREINTTDPNYYKWTQWMFLKFFEKGLAYKAEMAINWCPSCKIGLANEEVVGGKCERCGTEVTKKNKSQWMVKITAYADKLLEGLKALEYLPEIKTQQENWIGRSEGAEIDFVLKSEVEPTFYQFFEPGMIKDNEPFVEREAILAIVKHWSEDKYIGLKWKKVNWETFITGGVEKGQSPEEAAMTEIAQETGYKNMKLVKKLGKMHSKFFHVPKNQNRFGHFSLLYFELQNGERNEMSDKEKAIHEVIWLSKSQVDGFGLPSSHRYTWELLKNGDKEPTNKVKVFTTRPDTLFGATYLVLSPEHPLVGYLIHQALNAKAIDAYRKTAAKKTEIERTTEDKNTSTGSVLAKTGVELKGVKAINPASQEEIPVWISDYVLASYGTGAIMAVPAHDERDFEFAKRFKLPIRQVIMPSLIDKSNPPQQGKKEVFRNMVLVVLHDPKTDKYLTLKWKKQPWNTFITGGVEKGEDNLRAAKREIKEETGYSQVKLVRSLGVTEAFFFAAHKDENRRSNAEHFLFELVNDARDKVSEKESEQYEPNWLTLKELQTVHLQHAEGDLILKKLATGIESFEGEGVLINSGSFTKLPSEDAKKKIAEFVHGKLTVKYKLRDWVFSRQRYWGEPIPIISCEKCGFVAVLEKYLPVKLPLVKNYAPRDDGESPLASISKWVNVKCPKCKGPAKRETDTMPNWAGSSWYFLRYIDPQNKLAFADLKKLKYWMECPLASPKPCVGGVDWYNGGMEHVTLHLLYSRFWNRFLYDLGLVPTEEPYKKRTAHGLILAEGGVKMSKSKGNVVNPDPLIKEFGADALRLYEMFMGPFNQAIAWDNHGILGTSRFLERVWKLYLRKYENIRKYEKGSELEKLLHKTIKKVSEDIESMSFNTAISAMMIFVNEAEKKPDLLTTNDLRLFLKILAPFAPHVAEELWGKISISQTLNVKGQKFNSIHLQPWPQFDPKLIEEETFTLVVQINGKVRDSFEVPMGISQKEAESLTLARENVKKYLSTKPKRVIYVPGRLINIVI